MASIIGNCFFAESKVDNDTSELRGQLSFTLVLLFLLCLLLSRGTSDEEKRRSPTQKLCFTSDYPTNPGKIHWPAWPTSTNVIIAELLLEGKVGYAIMLVSAQVSTSSTGHGIAHPGDVKEIEASPI